MRPYTLLAIVLWISAGGWAQLGAAPAPASTGDTIASLKAVYDQQSALISADHANGQRTLDDRYLQELAAIKTRTQKAGNLNGVLAMDAEIKRFQSELTVPEASPAGAPAELATLQATHCRTRTELKRQRATRAVQLAAAYTDRLAQLRKSLTVAGRLEQALAVNAEMDRVKSLPEMAAAAFDAAVAAAPPASAGLTNAAAGAVDADAAALSQLELPAGVKITPGVPSRSSPGGGAALKALSLSPTPPSRLLRKLSVTALIGTDVAPVRQTYSSSYSSTSSQSGDTSHTLRLGIRPANTQYQFGGGKLVVQYFTRALGTQAKITPREVSVQTIPLPSIGASTPITVDCAPVSFHNYSYKYRSTYGSSYTSEYGSAFYGAVLSVFDADGTLAYQAASNANLDELGARQAP